MNAERNAIEIALPVVVPVADDSRAIEFIFPPSKTSGSNHDLVQWLLLAVMAIVLVIFTATSWNSFHAL